MSVLSMSSSRTILSMWVLNKFVGSRLRAWMSSDTHTLMREENDLMIALDCLIIVFHTMMCIAKASVRGPDIGRQGQRLLVSCDGLFIFAD